MSRTIGFVIFAIVLFLLYFMFQYVLGHWFDVSWVLKDFAGRFEASPSLTTFALTLCVIFGLWVIVALGRWVLVSVYDAVLGVRNVKAAREQAAATHSLEKSLIINSPALKKSWLRTAEAVFSAAVWIFFIYLFQTIVTTFAWILGLEHIYSYNFSPDSVNSTMEALLLAMYTAIASMVILVSWAQWNYWRYGRLERRKARPLVSREEVAEHFEVTVDMVEEMQSAKYATIQPAPFAIVYRDPNTKGTAK